MLNSLDLEQWPKPKGSKNCDKNSGKSEALNEVSFFRRKFTKNLLLWTLECKLCNE